MARHRRDDEFAAADPTVVLPAVAASDASADEDAEDFADVPPAGRRRGGRTVSPLLLGAGGVALTLVMVVGGWALAGGQGGGDPLVFPWSSDTPGPIDVSISLEPTVLPSPSDAATPSPSVASPRPTRSRSASPSPTVSVSRSTESVAATTMTATAMPLNDWAGGYVAQFVVTNTGKTAARWTVEVEFAKPVRIDQVWNASMKTTTQTHAVFSSVQDLAPGQSVGFGIRAFYDGRTPAVPVTCTIDGKQFPCPSA
ncbi:cellulose binding domain-containing protein [Hamadaea sp. NPDC050747]|uniref:cellulose binding domain-containing protein n=1 Tax=Hamadaea sp. NPDC050747 TaxID=3155789 RepID=UPI003404411B